MGRRLRFPTIFRGMEKWKHAPEPNFKGRLELDEDLRELVPFIDWRFFFYAWSVGEKSEAAAALKRDAEAELERLVAEGWTRARAVLEFVRVERHGDSLDVLAPECACGVRHPPVARLHFLRMQEAGEGEPLRSVADYFSPVEPDWLGMFALSAGLGADERARAFDAAGDPYRALLVRTLVVRLTEAFSEKLHRDVMKKWWGYAPDRPFGTRPVPGYPTTPDHSEILTLWRLLRPETIGMQITASRMMQPEASICGYYVAHPASRYFSISHIGEDQLRDYARRKGWPLETARKELSRLL